MEGGAWFREVHGRAPLPGEEESLYSYDYLRPRLSGAQLMEVLGIARITRDSTEVPRFQVLPERFHLSRLLPALGWYFANLRAGSVSHQRVIDELETFLPHGPPSYAGVPRGNDF